MSEKKVGKRLLTWVLVLVMTLSLLPLNVLADEGDYVFDDADTAKGATDVTAKKRKAAPTARETTLSRCLSRVLRKIIRSRMTSPQTWCWWWIRPAQWMTVY